jgi:hypothetical protein
VILFIGAKLYLIQQQENLYGVLPQTVLRPTSRIADDLGFADWGRQSVMMS